MVPAFVRLSTTLGMVLFVLGLSLSLFTPPTALMVTGVLLLAAGGVAAWYSSITPELPSTQTESS